MNCAECNGVIENFRYKKYCSAECMNKSRSSRKVLCADCGKMVIEVDRFFKKSAKIRNLDKWRLCFDCLIIRKKEEYDRLRKTVSAIIPNT